MGEYLLQRSLSYIDSSSNSHVNAVPLINSDEVIQYSSINITSDLIFPFGQCIARNNSNYIVVLRWEKRVNIHKSATCDRYESQPQKPHSRCCWWWEEWKFHSLESHTEKLNFIHFFYFSIFSLHTLHSPEENPCYRCFNLQLVSKNVILLIHNEIDINSKCSSSPESVRCPEDITLTDTEPPELRSDFRSIVLFSE